MHTDETDRLLRRIRGARYAGGYDLARLTDPGAQAALAAHLVQRIESARIQFAVLDAPPFLVTTQLGDARLAELDELAAAAAKEE